VPTYASIQGPLIELQKSELKDKVSEVLLESIDEAITDLLSREIVDALYLHLQKVHSIPKNDVPYKIETLCSTLNGVFGTSGTATIGKAIARKLFSKLELTFPAGPCRTLSDYVQEARVRDRERSTKS